MKILVVIGRAIALFIGLLLVLGGGSCVFLSAPDIFKGNGLALILAVVCVGMLLLGIQLAKWAIGWNGMAEKSENKAGLDARIESRDHESDHS